MERKYRHYGFDHWDPDLFREIKNEPYFEKPKFGTGLYACLREDKGGKSWHYFLNNDFTEYAYTLETHFDFDLKEDANVYTISTYEDIANLEKYILNPERIEKLSSCFPSTIYLDFEAMLKDGYDAIYVDMESDPVRVRYALYAWDVNTLLVLNKDVVIAD